jgi:MYXO-CTERM domain-containing protein
MNRACIVLLTVVLHQFHPSEALACSATPLVVSPLLPQENASGVGLDAALIASSNTGVPLEFELVKADSPADLADGGVEDVELGVDCGEETEGRRYVCVAKPADGLEPNTNYVWKVSSEFARVAPDWRSFRTSKGASSVGETKVDVEIVEETYVDKHPCGQNHEVTLEVDVNALQNPVVFNIPAVRWAPYYSGGPVLLTESGSTQQIKVWWPPECFDAELISVTGERQVLTELCAELDVEARKRKYGDESDDSESKASDSSSGCTAGPRSPGNVLWLGAMAALVGSVAWRRRKPAAQPTR